jgi:hypothetical protein
MKGFLRSGKADVEKPHYHLVYFAPDATQPLVCYENDHTHQVQQNQDGTFSLLPAEDGHTHEGFTAHNPKPKKLVDEDESETVGRLYALFHAAMENESDALKDGDECDRFYSGDQWDETVKAELAEQNRACLTINLTELYVDGTLGQQRQSRTDLRFLPIEGSDQRVMDVLNLLWKVCMEKSSYEQEESSVFEDQFITGRGNFNFFVDMMSDFRGDIKIECFPRDQVVYGPHSKLDASDADFLVKYQWWSMGNLKARYPKKADEIEQTYREFMGSPGGPHVNYSGDQYAKSKNRTSDFGPMDGVIGKDLVIDIARKEMRVFELQEKIRFMTTVLVNEEKDDFINALGWSKKDIKQAESLRDEKGQQIFEIIENIPIQKIRIVRVCGRVLLSDENPATLGVDDFHVVPVYGKKRKNNFWGKVKSAKDPQRELNKRVSQAMDAGNKSMGSGWFYDQGTFTSPAQAAKFRKNSAKSGWVQEVANVLAPPKREEGGKFPGEIVGLGEQSRATLKELLSTASTQHAGANTSGAAIMQGEKAGLVGVEKFFDNLSYSKRKLGLLFIGNIRKYYSADRIYRIVANQHSKKPVELGGVPFDQYSYESIIDLLDNADFSKCDVSIGEASWSPTSRLATLSIMTDLAAKGQQVPIQIIGNLLDAPEEIKQQLIQTVSQQEQQAAEGEQNKYNSEVEKSLIGQGIIPPAVAQRYGIPPRLGPEQPMQVQPTPQPSQVGAYDEGAAGLIP